ncbi:MAG: hypothetical protein KY455_12210 [Euryarchaeota archaeon]|nr:hypothetical protein [Euryarchaeota archaeon]
MRFNRDCENFSEGGFTPFVHMGPTGVFSEPTGRCRVQRIGLSGCPSDCPAYRAEG